MAKYKFASIIMRIKKIMTLLISSSLVSSIIPVYAEQYDEYDNLYSEEYENLTSENNIDNIKIDDNEEDGKIHCCRCGCCIPDEEIPEPIEEEIFCTECERDLTKQEMERNARELAHELPHYSQMKKDNRFTHFVPSSRNDLKSGDIMILSDVMYLYVYIDDEIYTWYEIQYGQLTEELPNLRFTDYADFYRFNIVKPAYIKPDGLMAVQGSSLSSISLPHGYTWQEKDVILDEIGEHEFYIDYTPDNLLMYGRILNIKVTVNVLKPSMGVEYPKDRYTISYRPELKLADIILPTGWHFENENDLLDIGSGYYTAVFEEDETYDYIQPTDPVSIKITVEKATVFVDDIYITIDKGMILTNSVLPKMNDGILEWDVTQNVATENIILSCHYIPNDLSRYLISKNIPVHITVKEDEIEDIGKPENPNPTPDPDVPDEPNIPNVPDTPVQPEIPDKKPEPENPDKTPSEDNEDIDEDKKDDEKDKDDEINKGENEENKGDKEETEDKEQDKEDKKEDDNQDIDDKDIEDDKKPDDKEEEKPEENNPEDSDKNQGDVIIDSSTGEIKPAEPTPTPKPKDEYENFEIISSENKDIISSVVVSYTDNNGNKITTDKVIQGKVGDIYSVKQKDINGYKVYKLPNNAKGVISQDVTYVTFVYNRQQEQLEELKIMSAVTNSNNSMQNNTNNSMQSNATMIQSSNSGNTNTQIIQSKPNVTTMTTQSSTNKTQTQTTQTAKPQQTTSPSFTVNAGSVNTNSNQSTTKPPTAVKTPEQLKREEEEKQKEKDKDNNRYEMTTSNQNSGETNDKKQNPIVSMTLGGNSNNNNTNTNQESNSQQTNDNKNDNPQNILENMNLTPQQQEKPSSPNVNSPIGVNPLIKDNTKEDESDNDTIDKDGINLGDDDEEDEDEKTEKDKETDKKNNKDDKKGETKKKPIVLVVGLVVAVIGVIGSIIFFIKKRP